ncbi:amidohydrolase [Vibrio sp. UCD-FRSSP16_10]|uniref:carbon-nitrogen hydrolase family protein n=1 Tax=unclassified Vibrio TaxID=2614977 RepID=UPI0007FF96C7|nr:MULTISPECIES: carbon-nitrogen hydrolase family protein [unclassified Vibrio]OBT17430.1 amidohydrolase [Vibrio sp. UCD-FRSSP16_30]OBT23199.1 amidohydrolase [Vibrio sp. UCD-FRSSP16_10]
MESSKIGLIQMTSGKDVTENYQYIETQVRELASQNCQLIVTPENSLLFDSAQAYQVLAEDLNSGPIQSQLAELAKELAVWIVIGSFPIRADEGKLYSTCLVFNDQGELATHYNKMHLFDVDVEDGHGSYRESDCFEHGHQPQVVATPLGKLGLTICYDLRFPHLFNVLREQGADLILVPAAFTAVTGEAHWETLLRARAIENQAWVIGVGQCGQHSSQRHTWGHSMVIDPWGKVVAKGATEPCNLTAEIELHQVEQIRKAMPVASHQKISNLIKNEDN